MAVTTIVVPTMVASVTIHLSAWSSTDWLKVAPISTPSPSTTGL